MKLSVSFTLDTVDPKEKEVAIYLRSFHQRSPEKKQFIIDALHKAIFNDTVEDSIDKLSQIRDAIDMLSEKARNVPTPVSSASRLAPVMHVGSGSGGFKADVPDTVRDASSAMTAMFDSAFD